MTKFSKAVLAFLFLCASQLVAANPPTIACGSYRVAPPDTCNAFRQAYDTNGNPVGGIRPLTIVNGNGYSQQMISVPVGGQPPQGYCPLENRVGNSIISGALGAIIGAVTGDNESSVRRGAGIGAAIGYFIPCSAAPQQQVVTIQNQQPQQGYQQIPVGEPGCVDATVRGRRGCYSIEFLKAQIGN